MQRARSKANSPRYDRSLVHFRFILSSSSSPTHRRVSASTLRYELQLPLTLVHSHSFRLCSASSALLIAAALSLPLRDYLSPLSSVVSIFDVCGDGCCLDPSRSVALIASVMSAASSFSSLLPVSSSASPPSRRVNAVLSHLQLSAISASSASAGRSSSAPLVSVASREGGVAVLVINNPPVNSLHPTVQQALDSCYRECCSDASLKAVVITGAGNTFMAGADIAHLRQQQRSNAKPADIQQWIRAGDEIFNRLESGPLPTVAAVNGDALGGGCELALACNARVCSDKAAFGLPELSLGIIPGLGGTQRLPRVIGLEKAVTLTLSGKVDTAQLTQT